MERYTKLRAVILDLDGVVTFTAKLHAAAWKELFDDFLRRRSEELGEEFHPFDIRLDYSRYVDGKPRRDGIVSFLASRGIEIPAGNASDSPDSPTLWSLGTKKNELFREKLEHLGVDVDYEAVRFVRELHSEHVKTGLASSSKNATSILERAGLGHLFGAIVDGLVSESLGLQGKPEPDIFVKCLEMLEPQVQPRDAAVVEDAISGVEAGRKGGFGLVLGVDREAAGQLQNHGADWVIRSFEGVTAKQFIDVYSSRSKAA